MAVLKVSSQVYLEKTILNIVIRFLRKEYNATVSKPLNMVAYYEYKVEGDGLPKGSYELTVECKEIVPKVFSITVE